MPRLVDRRKTIGMAREWPRTAAELVREQERLARAKPPPWPFTEGSLVAGCFVCFPRGPTGRGAAGDPAWAAAATEQDASVVRGAAGAPYAPGLLALREGRLLEAALRALRHRPEVVLVDATGRDHPRGAGLALHLGAVLDLPTVVARCGRVAGGRRPGGQQHSAARRRARGLLAAHAARRAPAGGAPRLAHGRGDGARHRPRLGASDEDARAAAGRTEARAGLARRR
jgi:deoxyinosine 3'endonuclease (endonuclease V)